LQLQYDEYFNFYEVALANANFSHFLYMRNHGFYVFLHFYIREYAVLFGARVVCNDECLATGVERAGRVLQLVPVCVDRPVEELMD
jgi:heme exporter protein D